MKGRIRVWRHRAAKSYPWIVSHRGGSYAFIRWETAIRFAFKIAQEAS